MVTKEESIGLRVGAITLFLMAMLLFAETQER
jgi:hypothetical protein